MKMRHKLGFTLIELIIVITLLGIVAGVGGALLLHGIRAAHQQDKVAQGDWQAYVALERMVRELRDIDYDNTGVLTFAANSISFVDIYGESINYSLSGT